MGADIRLHTFFIGHNQMTGPMNEISGGLTHVGQMMEEAGRKGTRSASMMTKEWDRFRRHFKYAVAGFGTYEIFNAISRLRDYQTEIANLNAKLETTPQVLNELGQEAIRISARTATPLNEVLQSFQNIAQSIPGISDNVRKHLIPAMAEVEAMGARVTGAQPAAFGATLLGIMNAFYGVEAFHGDPEKAVARLEKIASMVVAMRFRNPRLQGQDLSRALPMLTQGAVVGGFTLQQALGLFTLTQRQLINPNTTALYLRQLMMRMKNPTRAEQPYFARAGLSRAELNNMSGMEVLTHLEKFGLALPGGLPAGTDIDKFLKTGNWKRLNLQGEAADFFTKAIGGRMQSLAAMRAVLANVQQLPIEEKALGRAEKDDEVRRRFHSQIAEMPLQAMQVKVSDATTAIGTVLLPGIDTLAKGMGKMADETINVSRKLNDMRNFIDKHTEDVPILHGKIGGATEIATLIAGGYVSRRLFKSTRLRGLLTKVPGLRRFAAAAGNVEGGPLGAALQAERGILSTEAAANALAGRAMGTPSAPYWVVIHPLSKSQVPELFKHSFLDPNSPGGLGPTDVIAGGWAANQARKIARRFGFRGTRKAEIEFGSQWLEHAAPGLTARIGMKAIPFVGSAYEFFQPGNVFNPAATGQGMTGIDLGGGYRRQVPKGGIIDRFMQQIHGRRIPRGLQSVFSSYAAHPTQHNQMRLERAIANYGMQTAIASAHRGPHKHTGIEDAILGMFRLGPGHQLRLSHAGKRGDAAGYVEATLTLEPSQEFRKLLMPQQVKVHIPINQGAPPPKSRARNRTHRSK